MTKKFTSTDDTRDNDNASFINIEIPSVKISTILIHLLDDKCNHKSISICISVDKTH